jgi:flagellar biosynthesis protein FlhF
MQLRKFYGRTMSGALAQVKRELGHDALILETKSISSGSPAERTHPGARFEVLAARDPYAARPALPAAAPVPKPTPASPRTDRRPNPYVKQNTPITPPPARGRTVLEDLGLLRAQISQLLEGDPDPAGGNAAKLDLHEYHGLIEQGVNHQVLAPHFRRWLQWRTAPPVIRSYLAKTHGGPAGLMKGESLREWLWLSWSGQQGLLGAERPAEESKPQGRPRILGLVGPTGGGKTTTLAKLSSIIRQEKRQNAVILTLDTLRFGATEQWKRYARLMDIQVEEIVSPTDLSRSMERWGELDWIGIDTPGGMTPESEPGRRYGSILAQCPWTETVLVLPATQQESAGREQMKRSRALGARKALFSKLDETSHYGGIVNLTIDGDWKIDSFATGPRVPEDWEPSSPRALWHRVLAPERAGLARGGDR